MKPVYGIIGGLALAAALVLIAVFITAPHEPERPMVYMVYDIGKGDLSYADSAYRGLFAAQEKLLFDKREFTRADRGRLPGLMKSTGREKPGLVITLGYTYTDETMQLAQDNPDITFLAIDQAGTGAANVKTYEITAYGGSYLAGVLAASVTKTRNIGIILGTQSDLMEAFQQGYLDGARAADPAIRVQEAYVRDNSSDGFSDPARAKEIADGMYRDGADVIYLVAGYSNNGAVAGAKERPGRYVIGVDSDQTSLGPSVVLASVIKRVDRVVYTGIVEYLDGSFTSGGKVSGLEDGVTGLSFNPRFESYNATVMQWEEKAREEEARYLAAR
ncbi:MAG: BMP family ABC transporter substrate-binding protein [Methanoregula sp.]|jgi:basic membrane protein A|nr:BMP family ABC transporter substrate-binding protein [Methanoregula sp.]